MKRITRRNFLKNSTLLGLGLSVPRLALGSDSPSQSSGPNAAVRLGIVGMGGVKTIGGVGGRGHQLIARLRQIPTAKIAALCDVDQEFLDREAQPFRDRGEKVTTYRDLRRMFDDKSLDAVVIATPNHWHALATVWACQSGKDVYVEKPFAYNIWEGRQMVAAARKHGRMVQVGTQSRSSTVLHEAFDYLHSGQLGAIRYAHALVYRARDPLVKVFAPTPVPPSVDYDLWCGPAPKTPLMRQQLHYEWHWFWTTGGGELCNNGIHVIDICRWALGQNRIAPRAMSIGGRYAFDDGGETPNTQIVILDYQPAPILCEVRNVRTAKGPDAMGKFRNRNKGVVIDCEGGYFAGDATGGVFFDKQDKKVKEILEDKAADPEKIHLTKFLTSVRSRKTSDLAAEALEGHLSTACCHMGNISHRLGKVTPLETIQEKLQANHELINAFERCRDYLRENSVELGKTPAVLGPWVTFDAQEEKFVGEFAEPANTLAQREYRRPYIVPKIA